MSLALRYSHVRPTGRYFYAFKANGRVYQVPYFSLRRLGNLRNVRRTHVSKQ